MSSYPAQQQPCPRCRYPIAPGTPVCPNCGLAFSGMAGTPSASNSFPPTPQPGASTSYGGAPTGENFGAPGFDPQPNVGPGSQPLPGTPSAPFQPAAPANQPAPGASGAYPGFSANQQQPGPSGAFPTYPNSQPPAGASGAFPATPGNQQPAGASGAYPGFPGGQQPSAYPGSQQPAGWSGGQPFSGYTGQPTQPGMPGSTATYPGAPAGYPGQPPFGGPFPPGTTMAPPAKPSQRSRNIALIVLAALIILGAGGGTIYLLTRPKPAITVTSIYKSGTTLAGSAGSSFHIRGSDFSSNSTIIFLLDEQQTPGNQGVVSSDTGAFSVDLTVTPGWPMGQHTLTARDASNYETKVGQAVIIVSPGQAGTPGPNGAPPDNSSFTIKVTGQRHFKTTGQQLPDFTYTLTVVGQADPAGGTVCNPTFDDGKPHTSTGTDSQGNKVTETTTLKCSGTYKAGKVSYTETILTDQVVFQNGPTCTSAAPHNDALITGTFKDATNSSGTFSSDPSVYNCTQGGPQAVDAQEGTWTGVSS